MGRVCVFRARPSKSSGGRASDGVLRKQEGIVFDGLTLGEELTLRASAVGHAAKERIVVPTSGAQTAVPIVLSKIE